MRINVLGLGSTLTSYKDTDQTQTTIGVNDIFRHYPTDYLVILDKPTKFTPERLAIMLESSSATLITHIDYWADFFPHTMLYKLANARGDISMLDSDRLIYSNNTPFVACVMAYKLGASEIVTYGADYTDHIHLSSKDKQLMVQRHFLSLKDELNKRGVKLYVSSRESALAKVLPIWID